MDYKVLYRKYRPDTFENVLGQDYTVSILKNAIINNKIAHAYIFNGPRGTGKTSTAKIFAKTINCENPVNGEACGKCNSCINIGNNPDIIEIDAASNNGVEEIRELINNVKIAPSYCKYKVYIIDEVHMMTTNAFNALLLTLEEPPSHVVFILATTNVESVPITILSRCQKFDFKRISNDIIKNNIKNICKKEKIDIDDEAISEISYLAEGGMRDALSILDQLASENSKITLDLIMDNFGSVPLVIIDNIIEAIDKNDSDSLKSNIDKLRESNVDYKIFIKKMIDKLSNVAFSKQPKNNLDVENIKKIIFDLVNIINNYNINIDPFILIELTLLEHIKLENISTPVVETDKKETINENKNEEKIDKIISREIINEEKTPENEEKNNEKSEIIQKTVFDKKIRINNCFVNVSKKYKTEAQEKIKKIIKENFDDKFLLSMLEDVEVVAASDKYYMLSHQLESTVNLINMNFEKIENKLDDIKIVALTGDEWNEEKENYIKNKDDKVEYKYIEEKIEEKSESNEISDTLSMEELAKNLFSPNKIEIN